MNRRIFRQFRSRRAEPLPKESPYEQLWPTDGNEGALFVGQVSWPAVDAHVGPAENTRNRPTGSVFNGVDLPSKGLAVLPTRNF